MKFPAPPTTTPSNWLLGEWLDCLKNNCQCTWSRQMVELPHDETAAVIVIVRAGQPGAGKKTCVRADGHDSDFLEHEETLSMCAELGIDPRKLNYKF